MSSVQKANRAISLIVNELALKYNFNPDEALEFLVGEKAREDKGPCQKVKENKPARKGRARRIPLPWLGKPNDKCCSGLSYNLGLYTQCENEVKDTKYCGFCEQKKAEHGEFPHGTIDDRMKDGYDGTNGKPVIPYGNILEKKKISKDVVLAYAKEIGVTIPEQMFMIVKKPRGRPKKEQNIAVNDSSSEDDAVKKKRGRPKKAVVIENNSGLLGNILVDKSPQKEITSTSLVKKIVAPVNNTNSANENKDTSQNIQVENDDESHGDNDDDDDDDDDDEEDCLEEIEGVEMIHNGIKYFKTDANELYDPDSETHVANWDPETSSVICI